METKKYSRKFFPTSLYIDPHLIDFIEYKARENSLSPSRNGFINYILYIWAIDNGYSRKKTYKLSKKRVDKM